LNHKTVTDAQQPGKPRVPKWLIAGACLVVAFLVIIGIGTAAAVIWLLAEDVFDDDTTQLAVLAVAGGALGSAISALLSACERISHGWELSDGTKVPEDEPKDKFVARMIPFFLIRPLLGAATGLFVYVGVVGGYLIVTTTDLNSSDFSPEGIAFLAILSGLFAKTFLERLRAVFDSLFGK
jgi:hypothetical protein